jgi:hypothetical protein
MRLVILLLIFGLFLPKAYAQNVSQAEWNREYNESSALAVKLFPDLPSPNSAMRKETGYLFKSMSYCPRLLTDSYTPLFLAIIGGQALKVTPQWEALNSAEKTEAFQEITYCTNLMALAMAAQSRYITSLQTAPSSVTPGGFVPDSSDNPEVWKIYHPNSAPSYTAVWNGAGYTVMPDNN